MFYPLCYRGPHDFRSRCFAESQTTNEMLAAGQREEAEHAISVSPRDSISDKCNETMGNERAINNIPPLSLPLPPPFLPVSSSVPLYFLSLLISLNGIFSFSGEYFFAYVLHASFCIYVTCLLIYNAGAEFCEI